MCNRGLETCRRQIPHASPMDAWEWRSPNGKDRSCSETDTLHPGHCDPAGWRVRRFLDRKLRYAAGWGGDREANGNPAGPAYPSATGAGPNLCSRSLPVVGTGSSDSHPTYSAAHATSGTDANTRRPCRQPNAPFWSCAGHARDSAITPGQPCSCLSSLAPSGKHRG